jgi:hypothetical protein
MFVTCRLYRCPDPVRCLIRQQRSLRCGRRPSRHGQVGLQFAQGLVDTVPEKTDGHCDKRSDDRVRGERSVEEAEVNLVGEGGSV